MSNELMILKLNNEIISMFAILDGWLDDDNKFSWEDSRPVSVFHDTLCRILRDNHYLLELIRNSTDVFPVSEHEQRGDERFTTGKQILQGLENAAAEHGSYQGRSSVVWEDTQATLRSALREQLYECLCLIDTFPAKRLNVVSIQHLKLNMEEAITLLLKNGLHHINVSHGSLESAHVR